MLFRYISVQQTWNSIICENPREKSAKIRVKFFFDQPSGVTNLRSKLTDGKYLIVACSELFVHRDEPVLDGYFFRQKR